MKLRIVDHAGAFAEDKDAASRLRKEHVEKALAKAEKVTLDFSGVELATQSFIHALIADIIRKRGSDVLDDLSFKECNASLKSLIRVVAEYSQEDVAEPEEVPNSEIQRTAPAKKKRRR